jgi:tetratricopeptide (TPR) repeat protein
MKKPLITASTHVLPYEQLEPRWGFERLCLWLVTDEGYLRAEHYGLAGNEQGRDIIAYWPTRNGEELWYFQSKRHKRIDTPTLIEEVDKVIQLKKEKTDLNPVGIIFIAPTTISAEIRDNVRDYCHNQQLKSDFWAVTELDQRVKKHKRIVDEFFASPFALAPIQASQLSNVNTQTSLEVSDLVKLLFFRPLPDRNQNLVGRTAIIEQIIDLINARRIIAILGISGIGKSALLRELYEFMEADSVFWYDFAFGPVSLDDLLGQLFRFIDQKSGSNLEAVLLSRQFTSNDLISLAIQKLNQNPYFLLFDSLEQASSHPEINNFLSTLKTHLRIGTVIVTSQQKPTFYSAPDETQKLAVTIILSGISESDARDYFERQGVSLASDLASALSVSDGILPIAMELCLSLITNETTETDLIEIVEKAESNLIEQLFNHLYRRLDEYERGLLTTASCFNLPFTAEGLITAHSSLSSQSGLAPVLQNLRDKVLIQTIAEDYLTVHQIISRLMLSYVDNPNRYRLQLADHLANQDYEYPQGPFLEAVLLYAQVDEFNKAADVALDLMDMLMPYYPDLAQTIISGFKEEQVLPEKWVWILNDKGSIAQHWRRYHEAETLYQEAFYKAGKTGNKAAAALALQRLGTLYHERDFAKAKQYYMDCLALKKEIEDIEGQSQIYNNLASLYISEHDFTAAKSMIERGMTILDEINAEQWRRLSLIGNLGHLHAELREWEKADEYAMRVLRIAQDADMPHHETMAYYNLGIHQDKQGNKNKAQEFFSKALEIAQRYKLWEHEERTRRALGQLYYELGQFDEAVKQFEVVIAIEEEIEDSSHLATTYFDTGSFYWHKGDKQKALDYYTKGFELFEHLVTDEEKASAFLNNALGLATASENTSGIVAALKELRKRLADDMPQYILAEVYRILGRIYLDLLHKERIGLVCMKQRITILAQIERYREQVSALNDLGVTYEDVARYSDALPTIGAAIYLAQVYGFHELTAISHYNRANVNTKIGFWDLAEADYKTALDLASHVESPHFPDSVRHNLGELYRRSGQPEIAIELLRESLDFSRREEDVEGEIRTLNNLGLAYERAEQFNEAETCFEKALSLSRQHYYKRDEANVLISSGNLYAELENFEKAQVCYEKSLLISREIEDIELEEGSVMSLAYAHWQLGTFDSVEEMFDKATERAAELKHYENYKEFVLLAADIYLDADKIEDAAKMFEQALITSIISEVDYLPELIGNYKETGYLPQFLETIFRICQALGFLLEQDLKEKAELLYGKLLETIDEAWQGMAAWVVDLLSPIFQYLVDLPEEPLLLYVLSKWGDSDNSSE